jgi:hypothetical protein
MKIREDLMTNLSNGGFGFSCGCGACPPSALSRRKFLCAGTAGAVAAAATAAVIGTASAQQPAGGVAPGRSILIKGGCVLTLDRAFGDFETADILIEGKSIAAVRPNISAPNAEVIDAERMIVMPGFVDTHRHMWQGILRNVLPDGSLEDYRDVVQRTFGAKYMPGDVYAGNLFSALGAIDSGVTCILDWSHIHNSPAHSDAAVRALFDSGVRAVFAYGNGHNETGRYWEIATSKFPGDIARLRKQYFSSDDQLVTAGVGAPPRRRPRCAEIPDRARGAGIRHPRRRPRQRPRPQDRHPRARQGGRHHPVAHRPPQRHAREQRGRRGGDEYGPAERRYRPDRRQGDEAQWRHARHQL